MPEKEIQPLEPFKLRLHHLLLALALILFAYRAYDYFVPAVFGIADEHGYVTTAKRLATTGNLALRQKEPLAFVGETMIQSQNDAELYYLRQPIGYPFLCAIFHRLIGDAGPFAVNPLCGLALLAGVYVLGRQLKNPLAGALAALVLALHPVLLYYTIKPLSHVPDMTIGVWALVAALAWKNSGRLSHALAVGIALAAAILIRYTNVLLVLPLVLILWDARKTVSWRKTLLHVPVAIAIVLAGLFILLAYHKVAFGDPFRTGYTAGGNERAFSLANLLAHAPTMLECLWEPATGLTFLWLPILGGALILALRDRFLLVLLLLWALPSLLLNTSYYGMPAHNHLLYARFALASYVPLLLLAFCWTEFFRKLRIPFQLAAALVALAAIVFIQFDPVMNARGTHMVKDPRNATWNDKGQLAVTRDMCRLMFAYSLLATSPGPDGKPVAPPGSLILADNFTEYFMEYVDAYTVFSPSMFDPKKIEARIADLDKYPMEFDPQRTREIKAFVGGRTQQELDKLLRKTFLKYLELPNRPVFVLTRERDDGTAINDDLGDIEKWKKRLNLPMKRVAGQGSPIGLWKIGENE